MQLFLKRCTIRPWRLDDADSIAMHANNRKVWLALRDVFPPPYTIQDAHEFLQRTTSEKPTTKFCIEIDGAAAGGIGIQLGEDVHRHTATLGYCPGEDFWRRGIITEAIKAFTDVWFGNFPLRRISAEVFANNPASACVLEKAGFIFEGRLRKKFIKDAKLPDARLYAKTRQKFAVVVPALNTRSLISRCDRTSRPLHRAPRGRSPICEGWNRSPPGQTVLCLRSPKAATRPKGES